RESGIRYTILRPVFFMENWLGMKERIEHGSLALPLSPDTRFQMIAVDDIGAFAALAFEHTGHWENRAVDIAGDDLSMTEVAQAFSRAAGRPVRYEQVPWDEFERQAGPEITVMYRWFEDVGYHVDIGAIRQQYPHLTNFARWLNTRWQSPQTEQKGSASA
ncbi:MAG TPA: NmrA family NAD(P)-binding protein, partial [Bryobacteraceae bacterium]